MINETYNNEMVAFQTKRTSHWNYLHSKRGLFNLGGYYRNKIISIYQNIVPKNSIILELGCGTGDLLSSLNPSRGVGIDFSEAALLIARKKFTGLDFHLGDAQNPGIQQETFDYIIISELVNDVFDVQLMLEAIKPYCDSDTRIIFNYYSHLWNIPLSIARRLGLASSQLQQNWLTKEDLNNLLEITGFQPLKSWGEILVPIYIPFISNFINRYLAKIFPFQTLDLTNFAISRKIPPPINSDLSVSIIVAARNEAGHINELLSRIPHMGKFTEVIFVEGNSTDHTYQIIEEEILKFPNLLPKLFKQNGKGKGDAVRLGFEMARGDILMILDADITVPPEDLPRFYNLIIEGKAEFVNGVRLVYPMDDNAMRFANLIGNKFFSWAFSWLLGQNIRDTLCGTKVITNAGYNKISKNRSYFGDFDPFGDFDLLFGAAHLNYKILEVPIRYRARKYGETNISRWKHGWLLLKMVAFAARKIKFQ